MNVVKEDKYGSFKMLQNGDPIHTERTKYKILDLSFQSMIKWSKLYCSLRKEFNCVEIIIPWLCEGAR